MSETDAIRGYLHVLIDHLPDGEVLEAYITLMLDTCRRWGVEVPTRPAAVAGDTTPGLNFPMRVGTRHGESPIAPDFLVYYQQVTNPQGGVRRITQSRMSPFGMLRMVSTEHRTGVAARRATNASHIF